MTEKYTYLRNPVPPNECVAATDKTTIARLKRYGWVEIKAAQYRVWQVANMKADRAMRAYSNVVRH